MVLFKQDFAFTCIPGSSRVPSPKGGGFTAQMIKAPDYLSEQSGAFADLFIFTFSYL